MFGIRFIKADPGNCLIQFRNGRIRRQGKGLSFYYFAPTTSLVSVPTVSTEAPFIFEEVTGDFQKVTVQGQVTYRISEPLKVSRLLNFTLDATGKRYVSDDPQKLSQRVINLTNVLTRAGLEKLSLREALRASETMERQVAAGLRVAAEIDALGLEILGLSILAIKPTPETSRALEAETRELLLREADEAIYARRNSAVEYERSIRENELNTEIAVENKKRQIREAQMDAERAVQEKQHQLREAEMTSRIALEEQNRELVALTVENSRQEAEAKAFSIGAVMKSLAGVDARVLQALTSAGMSPHQLVAAAFQELAEKADRIGQLNISPELLRELMNRQQPDDSTNGH
jgi:hypothetical protein